MHHDGSAAFHGGVSRIMKNCVQGWAGINSAPYSIVARLIHRGGLYAIPLVFGLLLDNFK
ncbi:MAG: hypothetical protein ABSH41_16690 [Syntrophobacteraceae bacterium]|jgi:hypothetical protein